MADNAQQVPREPRDLKNLLNLLDENRVFLHNSCREFDRGSIGEAKRIATVLRTLMHDSTRGSRSLLEQIGIKDMFWLDSTAGTDNPTLTGWPGLVAFSVDMHRGGEASRGSFVPLFRARQAQSGEAVDFDAWWNGPAIRDDTGENHSRWNLIAWFANKEGGAHVDPKLVTKYERIKSRGLGYEIRFGDRSISSFGDAIPGAIRQIAFEVESTLAITKSPYLESWGITVDDTYQRPAIERS